jgi:PAS domain S-box-containing protein
MDEGMKNLPLGIATRLTLVFVIFAAVLVAGVGVLAFENGRTSLQAAAVSELLSTAIEKQAALDAWMAQGQDTLVNIARSPHLQAEVAAVAAPGSAAADGPAPGRVVEDLRNWTGAGRGFRELLVLDPESGQVLAATDAGDVGKFKEDQPFFLNGKLGPFVQNPYHDLAFGGATATASAPILSADGRVVAVLAGHLDLAEMNDIITRRTGLHRTDEAYLVNTASLFVTQPRLMTDASILQRVVKSEAVIRCLARDSGAISAPDYRNVPALVVYRWLPTRQLCLITKIDLEETLTSEQSLGSAIFIAGLVVMLLASGLAYWLSRTITSPIRALTAGAVQVGRGNLAYRIKADAGDETGDLARAFNQMTSNLSRSLDETAHGQRMVLALGQAAKAVQRAHSRDEVLRVLAGEVTRLGYVPLISEVDADGKQLSSPYRLLPDRPLSVAEKLLGITLIDLVIAPAPDTYLDLVIREERGIFVESAHDLVAETLPEWARPMAQALAANLGLRQAILSPLTTGGKTQAVLAVAGAGLSEADVPAVTALASQAAIALDNARLYQETLAWATDLETRVQQRTGELRASEERYRALARAAPDMVFVIGQDDRVQYLNDFAASQFRVDPEGVIGEPRPLLFPGAAGEQQLQSLRRVLDTGSPLWSESSVNFGAGEAWLSTWLVPMRDQEGQVTAVMGVSRDITERKLAEEQLKAFSQDLERSNKELEQFAYVSSHDLQEPLRMVASYVQLLARRYRGKLDADADAFIGFAVDGANRMQDMINDLLALSRVGSRGKPFAPTPLDDVLDDVLENLKIAMEECRAVVTREPLPAVMGDRVQLGEVFQNLITNAIKFRGDEPPRVHIGARRDQTNQRAGRPCWTISVRDNGIGMDPQYFDRVFLIFQRLHSREEYPGTGIGLAICRKIVDRHGGRIWVESEPGKGATFYLTLPTSGAQPEGNPPMEGAVLEGAV